MKVLAFTSLVCLRWQMADGVHLALAKASIEISIHPRPEKHMPPS
jgi:hypothetical protein